MTRRDFEGFSNVIHNKLSVVSYQFLVNVEVASLKIIHGGIGNTGDGEGHAPLATGAALAAVVLPALITRVGLGVVETQRFAVSGDFHFVDMGVRSIDFNILIGARLHGLVHGMDEVGTAVGIDGMVTGMVGYHHAFQPVALGYTASHSQHDAVAEGHHRGLHILIIVVALRNIIGRHQQGALKIPMDE